MNFRLLCCLVVFLTMEVSQLEASGMPTSVNGNLKKIKKELQQRIRGIVSGDDGPIAGVTVQAVGSNEATITNPEGEYVINVSIGTVLRFSSVGYTTKELKVQATTMNVNLLQDQSSLDEVVVTAFGVTRDKKALGYSAQTIGGQEVAQTQRQNFLNSLQGRVAGATITPTTGLPGASAQMIIRGAVSLDGDNQPLFVVDGLPISNKTFDEYNLVGQGSFNRNNDYGNRAMDINPEEIESITILKDRKPLHYTERMVLLGQS